MPGSLQVNGGQFPSAGLRRRSSDANTYNESEVGRGLTQRRTTLHRRAEEDAVRSTGAGLASLKSHHRKIGQVARILLTLIIGAVLGCFSVSTKSTGVAFPDCPAVVPSTLASRPWFEQPFLELNSPFEYPVKDRPKPIRVLFLHDYKKAVQTSDPFLIDVYKAAMEHPNVEAHMWGPHYSGFSSQKHFTDNIEEKYGCGFFDIVFTSYERSGIFGSPDGTVEWWDVTDQRSFQCDTVFVVKTGDCNIGQCPDEHFPYLGNVTIVRYGFELTEVFAYEKLVALRHHKYGDVSNYPFQLYAHVPDSAHTTNYYPPQKWNDKTVDVRLFGKADAYYPLRMMIADAIEDGQTFIEPFRSTNPLPALTYEEVVQLPAGAPDRIDTPPFDFMHSNDVTFAKSMRETKICVFDGSVQMKAVRKYAQAALTGCVIAGELPTEHERILRNNTIELDPLWSIEQINRVLSDALADPVELQRKASFMYAYARQHFTSIGELDTMLDVVDRYRAGDRGYMTTTDFTSRCRDYYPRDAEDPPEMQTEHMRRLRPNWRYIPPWCSGEDFSI